MFKVLGKGLHPDGEDGSGEESADNVIKDVVVQLVVVDPLPDVVRNGDGREGED